MCISLAPSLLLLHEIIETWIFTEGIQFNFNKGKNFKIIKFYFSLFFLKFLALSLDNFFFKNNFKQMKKTIKSIKTISLSINRQNKIKSVQM